MTYLSPHDDCFDALLRAAKAATASIHVLIYSFTMTPLADILIEKHKTGLEVAVVADKTQSAGPHQKSLLQRLVDAGIPVTISTSMTGAILHTKALLIDMKLPGGANDNGSFSVFGSFNFSGTFDKKTGKATGAQAQDNVLVTENSAALVTFFYQQFLETQDYGRAHCEQLKPTTPPALPITIGEKQAAPPALLIKEKNESY